MASLDTEIYRVTGRSVVDFEKFATFEPALAITLQDRANDCARHTATHTNDDGEKRKDDDDRDCTRHSVSVVR